MAIVSISSTKEFWGRVFYYWQWTELSIPGDDRDRF
jgi:hypothetical protein